MRVCLCVHVCKSLPGKHQLPRQLTSTLSLHGVAEGQMCTHTHTLSQGYKCSHIQILWLDTHTQKHQTQLHWEKKNDLKVHLYFFSSLFRCGFLTVVGRLPQIFPALCTHARLGGGKNAGKKCWPTFYRGEKRKETKWRLKLCSAATALT